MTVSHRMSSTREWLAWKNMRNRCNNPNHQAYANYGGRGIRVFPEWDVPDVGFVRFFAHVGKRPKGRFDLDRIDNSRGYEPGNVRWATRKANVQNKRTNRRLTVGGQTKCVAEWAREAGLSSAAVLYRLRAGWSTADAVGLGAGRGNVLNGLRCRDRAPQVTANGRTMTIAAWADCVGIKANTIWTRLRKGWSPDFAVSTPVGPRRTCGAKSK